MKRTIVFNGWAAGHETWDLCTFEHDWIVSYIEQMSGLPERLVEEADEVMLVGFSMGGVTAQRMLLKYPEKVKGLVLVSATPRMMEDRAASWPGLSQRRLEALRWGTEMVFRNDPSPIYEEENMRRGLDFLQDHDLREEMKAFGGTDFARNLQVAVFQSDRDGIVRPHNAQFFKSVFPQAEVTMVPGNEHVLPIKVPELISSAVTRIVANMV